MKKNNLISKIKQFNINNEIAPVDHSGNLIYDEKITKGTLLPLRFQFEQFFEYNNNYEFFYNQLMDYTKKFGSISNFVQGKLWK